MNEVHTLQRTGTAEGGEIAQGVIQRESQYMGRKKKLYLWGSANAAASAKYRGFLGIETEFVGLSVWAAHHCTPRFT